MAKRRGPHPGDIVTTQRTEQTLTASLYKGPIPTADVAEGWKRLVPDAPERILRMAEDEASHRRTMERAEQGNIHEMRRKQMSLRQLRHLSGVGFVLLAFVFAGVCIYKGLDYAAVGALLVPVLAFARLLFPGARAKAGDE